MKAVENYNRDEISDKQTYLEKKARALEDLLYLLKSEKKIKPLLPETQSKSWYYSTLYLLNDVNIFSKVNAQLNKMYYFYTIFYK